MNIYENALRFNGQWRGYQQRVLDNLAAYNTDNKYHFAAAPGSGKTVLGLEIIIRLGAPCLVLSPNITIRQQWLQRAKEHFLLPGQNASNWLSTDIKTPSKITSITYQALYSALKHYTGPLVEQNGTEEVDYSSFELIATMKKHGITTLCLDEAHHLRNEWWRALETFVKELPGLSIISLTATPPYDATAAEWKRYIGMCGPIDEEIFTPELVREGSLCPHQDYVYLSWPTAEETAALNKFGSNVNECVTALLADQGFVRMVASHKGLQNPQAYSHIFLQNPDYLYALLIFMQACLIPFAPAFEDEMWEPLRRSLPTLNHVWFEIVLQGLLYTDTAAYDCTEEQRDAIKHHLRRYGCIHQHRVQLVGNHKLARLLTASQSKLAGIAAIVRAEHESLQGGLRMLVLCDHIKKQALKLVGTSENLYEMGAIPVFEMLRKANIGGITLGVLSGSVIVLPQAVCQAMQAELEPIGYSCSYIGLNNTGYCTFSSAANIGTLVRIVTKLFEAGFINVLVGTSALLGEGWDSPCINSLILASFVGSFMLSNQMRGRAIRAMAGQPDKASNIWHLACVQPGAAAPRLQSAGPDLALISRRFRTFLGASYTQDVIENGTARLGLDDMVFDAPGIEQHNSRSLLLAKDRAALRQRWQGAFAAVGNRFEVEEVRQIKRAQTASPGYLVTNSVLYSAASTAALALTAVQMLALGTANILVYALAALALGVLFRHFPRVLRLATPRQRVKKMAEALLKTLEFAGNIRPGYSWVETENAGSGSLLIYLKGGTIREKTLFATCLAEMFGPIEAPRYLLENPRRKMSPGKYYAIPEILGSNKKNAEHLQQALVPVVGKFNLVHTRFPGGGNTLLLAQMDSQTGEANKIVDSQMILKKLPDGYPKK